MLEQLFFPSRFVHNLIHILETQARERTLKETYKIITDLKLKYLTKKKDEKRKNFVTEPGRTFYLCSSSRLVRNQFYAMLEYKYQILVLLFHL